MYSQKNSNVNLVQLLKHFFLLYSDILKTHNYPIMQIFVRLLVLALPSICLDEVRELTPNIQRIEFQVLSTPTLLVKVKHLKREYLNVYPIYIYMLARSLLLINFKIIVQCRLWTTILFHTCPDYQPKYV